MYVTVTEYDELCAAIGLLAVIATGMVLGILTLIVS